VNCHIGIGCDNLLFRRELGALLELEITNGPGQGQITIDSTKVDEATGGADTSFLAFICILGENLGRG